jgi:hypothetical protein
MSQRIQRPFFLGFFGPFRTLSFKQGICPEVKVI